MEYEKLNLMQIGERTSLPHQDLWITNQTCGSSYESVAIPVMGIGVFKFPVELAADITAKVL
jgi:O-acetyl-ADP-ribose deacetylase (regulator of RNase III)